MHTLQRMYKHCCMRWEEQHTISFEVLQSVHDAVGTDFDSLCGTVSMEETDETTAILSRLKGLNLSAHTAGGLLANLIPRCQNEQHVQLRSGTSREVYMAYTGTILHAMVAVTTKEREDDTREELQKLLEIKDPTSSRSILHPNGFAIARADVMDAEGRYPYQLARRNGLKRLQADLETAKLLAESDGIARRSEAAGVLKQRVAELESAFDGWKVAAEDTPQESDLSLLAFRDTVPGRDSTSGDYEPKQHVKNCLRLVLLAANELESLKERSVSINQVGPTTLEESNLSCLSQATPFAKCVKKASWLESSAAPFCGTLHSDAKA